MADPTVAELQAQLTALQAQNVELRLLAWPKHPAADLAATSSLAEQVAQLAASVVAIQKQLDVHAGQQTNPSGTPSGTPPGLAAIRANDPPGQIYSNTGMKLVVPIAPAAGPDGNTGKAPEPPNLAEWNPARNT